MHEAFRGKIGAYVITPIFLRNLSRNLSETLGYPQKPSETPWNPSETLMEAPSNTLNRLDTNQISAEISLKPPWSLHENSGNYFQETTWNIVFLFTPLETLLEPPNDLKQLNTPLKTLWESLVSSLNPRITTWEPLVPLETHNKHLNFSETARNSSVPFWKPHWKHPDTSLSSSFILRLPSYQN